MDSIIVNTEYYDIIIYDVWDVGMWGFGYNNYNITHHNLITHQLFISNISEIVHPFSTCLGNHKATKKKIVISNLIKSKLTLSSLH